MKKTWKWLWSFLKIGCIGFGGGTSLIPVLEEEMVHNKKVVTKQEYDSAVLIASITPGALPVEISGGIGKIAGGLRGMMFAAVCMALPGVLMTIALLASMDTVDMAVIKQIELISIGITAFILSMLTKYIRGTFAWAKQKNRTFLARIIVLGVFVLSAGKSIVKVLGHFGVEVKSYLSISTVHILVMAFFVLCYAGKGRKISRVVIAGVLSVLYVLFVSKAEIMNHLVGNDKVCNILFRILQVVMLILAVYGVMKRNNKKQKVQYIPIRNLAREEGTWFLFLLFCSIPALIMVPNFLNYLGNGFFSSIISFGGGDAYLTVADSLFVEGGMISEADFYGRLVTVVNVLPGSILCKTLSGIGYYMGYAYGGLITGLAVALAGFACSVVGSCSVVSLVQFFFDKFEQIEVFQILKAWVKTIISGLLGTVILSLVYQCLNVAARYHCHGLIALSELLGIYVLNLVLEKKYGVSTGVNVVISCVAAFAIGNLIM